MPNLTDKDIDRLSRAAAEFHEPDDAGLSWSKFEQQFRQQLPDKPPGRWSAGRLRPYAWGSVILAVTGLTYFLTKNDPHTSNSTLTNGKQPTVNTQRAASGQSKTSLTPVNGKYDPSMPKENSVVPHDEAAAVVGTGSSMKKGKQPDALLRLTALNGIDQHKNAAAYLKKQRHFIHHRRAGELDLSANARDQKRNINSNDWSSVVDPLPSSPDNQAATAKAVATQTTAANRQAGGREAVFAILPDRENNPQSLHAILPNDSLLNRFPPITHSSAARGKHLDINRSMVIGFTAGPDYTNGGGITNDQLSDNIGITLGYYLTGRLSVNTGLIYTKKYYWTKGDGFRILGWPGTYFPVEFVNGSCNMWEIPLTVRYDFPAGAKTNFFINGGVSSYLMKKEDYTVFYHNGNRIYGKEFESDQHHNYLFSVINISAGIERQLGKGFSFQAEPFVKMPTQGIGLGNIKMNSYGLLFSFRYAPSLKKNRR